MQQKYVFAFCVSSTIIGCSGGDGSSPAAEHTFGTLHAAIEVSDVDNGVTAIRFDVVAVEDACDSQPIASDVVELEGEALASPLAESGAHAFADGLFVLEPGEYRVCATPLAGDEASAVCGSTDGTTSVEAEETTELVLTSQCTAAGNGALDVVVALNSPPVVTDLVLSPSKFITNCETLTLTATASDPNADTLAYAWSITAGPDGASLTATDSTATFSGPPGSYTLRLEVVDDVGGNGQLTFPVYVTEATCEVPDDVQAIFGQRCGPCHTAGSAGALSLADAAASYAGLVNRTSSAAACNDRVRVVPGDAEASYLMAKLYGDANICGTPMPRNAPTLSEEELGAIASWITSLPH